MTARLALLVLLLATVGCAVVDDALGQACDASDDCNVVNGVERAVVDARDLLECVHVDDDDGVCAGTPDREPASCVVDDDCRLAPEGRFPVEAECLDGACTCLANEVDCGLFSLVLESETCRCVTFGGEGDACFSPTTCDIGLTCDDGECRDAAPGGTACRDSGECASGVCADAAGPFGVCLGVVGDACGLVADCTGGLACDGNRCVDVGTSGASCRNDPDCDTFECFEGTCS